MSYKIIESTENEQLALEVLESLVNQHCSYKEIAEKMNKSPNYLFYLMKKYKEIWGFTGVLTQYHWFKKTGEINKIIDMYVNQKKSTIEIGQLYSLSDTTISSYLRKENVVIRPVGYESKTNQTIFEEINSEIKAYTVGLITADGNMARNERSLSITLTESDRYVLEQINERLLNNTGHILTSKKSKGKDTCILQFHGKKLCKDVAQYGIVPNKSDYLTKLSELIPEQFYHHYLRGLYDGDGVCSKYTSHSIHGIRIGYCAKNIEFVRSYRDFFHKQLNFPLNKLFNTGECWQVSWAAKKDLIAFYNYIYKDATIFLGRKKNKLYTFLYE